MLDTNSLYIRKVSQEKMNLLEQYIETKDPELLKKIDKLDEREKALITKNIIDNLK